jgi:hypothetical protein
MKNKTMTVILAACLWAPAAFSQSFVDQQQTNLAGYMWARSYEAWFQRITPATTGTLTRVDLTLYGPFNAGVATIRVFAGQRPPKIGSEVGMIGKVTVSLAHPTRSNVVFAIPLSVPVTAGQPYCIQFDPDSGISDPYGVAIGILNYPRGSLGLTHATGSMDWYPLNAVFKVWIQP